MNKERKRSGYHIEFINPRQTKKYKFYFFDYLYYMGKYIMRTDGARRVGVCRVLVY